MTDIERELEDPGEGAEMRDKGIRVPTWLIPVAVSAAGVLVGWGVNAQRMTDLERRTEQQSADVRQMESKLASHDTQIAVINAKLDTIIGELQTLNGKLEAKERQRP